MAEHPAAARAWRAAGRPLLAGRAGGPALVLDDPLSFWGGFDAATGRIIDEHHPQRGENVRGTILVMPAGRGSSSSSSVLAEAIRAGVGPCAILLAEADGIVVVGALVIRLLGGVVCPVVELSAVDHRRLRTGDHVELAPDGTLLIEPARALT